MVINAADEVAVEAFLQEKIGYLEIAKVLEATLSATPSETLSWEAIEAVDAWARRRAAEWLGVNR